MYGSWTENGLLKEIYKDSSETYNIVLYVPI